MWRGGGGREGTKNTKKMWKIECLFSPFPINEIEEYVNFILSPSLWCLGGCLFFIIPAMDVEEKKEGEEEGEEEVTAHKHNKKGEGEAAATRPDTSFITSVHLT